MFQTPHVTIQTCQSIIEKNRVLIKGLNDSVLKVWKHVKVVLRIYITYKRWLTISAVENKIGDKLQCLVICKLAAEY